MSGAAVTRQTIAASTATCRNAVEANGPNTSGAGELSRDGSDAGRGADADPGADVAAATGPDAAEGARGGAALAADLGLITVRSASSPSLALRAAGEAGRASG